MDPQPVSGRQVPDLRGGEAFDGERTRFAGTDLGSRRRQSGSNGRAEPLRPSGDQSSPTVQAEEVGQFLLTAGPALHGVQHS